MEILLEIILFLHRKVMINIEELEKIKKLV